MVQMTCISWNRSGIRVLIAVDIAINMTVVVIVVVVTFFVVCTCADKIFIIFLATMTRPLRNLKNRKTVDWL